MDYDEDRENFNEEMLFLNNAGLVLLTPFIQTLFERAGIIENHNFISDEKRSMGVLLLLHAATGESKLEIPELLLPRVLCGLSIGQKMDYNSKPGEQNIELVEGLLESVIEQWKVMASTSLEGLRESFIQRPGKLINEDDRFILKVERKAFDILLDQLPWSINIIKLPWMSNPIYVNWNR